MAIVEAVFWRRVCWRCSEVPVVVGGVSRAQIGIVFETSDLERGMLGLVDSGESGLVAIL